MPVSELELAGVIAVDDSGTPGVAPKSAFLHVNRKTWAAVIVPAAAVASLRTGLQLFIDGVRGEFGVDELHFTDIYNGRGAFKPVPIEKRYELFDLMATLFASFKLPIVVQTLSPQYLAETRQYMREWPKRLPWFKSHNHEHVGLLFLLCRVRMFMREQQQVLAKPLSLVIDEGLLKAGSAVSVPGWADLFLGGCASFQSSHQFPFLQLADFAAFVVARAQWIVSAGISKERDVQFLRIVSPERLWYVNLPMAKVSPNEDSAKQYGRVIQADRMLKRLPADPPW
ncbi:MAG: DUF3800 domain-containing protein [Proteobacteria bacterium]|nr:DUF3800 domain-containing protein [Pseudomonadota bacterium]